MAIRKKGSRVVVVDGVRYRWRIRRAPTYDQAAYAAPLVVPVQHADGGSVLLVHADGPRPDNWLTIEGAIVTPAMIAVSIREAVAAGWRPGEPGPAFRLAAKQAEEATESPDKSAVIPPHARFAPSAFTPVPSAAGQPPWAPLDDATIWFENATFHWFDWDAILKQLQFQRYRQGYVYVAGGSRVVVEDRGFTSQGDRKPRGYLWHVSLKHTRRWEGTLRFGAVLLAGFALPQPAIVTLQSHRFSDRNSLRAHLEGAVLRRYEREVLMECGAYRAGEGVQFG